MYNHLVYMHDNNSSRRVVIAGRSIAFPTSTVCASHFCASQSADAARRGSGNVSIPYLKKLNKTLGEVEMHSTTDVLCARGTSTSTSTSIGGANIEKEKTLYAESSPCLPVFRPPVWPAPRRPPLADSSLWTMEEEG